jgi:hypothetical protein
MLYTREHRPDESFRIYTNNSRNPTHQLEIRAAIRVLNFKGPPFS